MIVFSPHYPEQFLPKDAPRIAMIDDRKRRGWRLLCQLITEAGGEVVVIPRTVSDLFMGKLGVTSDALQVLRGARDITLAETYGKVLGQALELHLAELDKILATVQGIVLPGNEYDVPPAIYGEPTLHPKTQLPPSLDFRFETERVMLEHALQKPLPLLGICGGMQLLVALTGGKLLQHLPDALDATNTAHDGYLENVATDLLEWMECSYVEFLDDPHKPCPVNANHPIRITDDTSQFADIARKQLGMPALSDNTTLGVLSIHHQGALSQHINADTLKITAVAADGVVEAVEHRTHPFCIATQFHPEFDANGIALPLISALMAQCRK